MGKEIDANVFRASASSGVIEAKEGNGIIMFDMPLLSIIVPVYNVEQYLPRCLESILQSSYENWQLILVDDGSTDNSGQLCDEYVQKDARIEVFHIPNAGVSNARNVGLNYARGTYIGFVDSDDWIHAEMYYKMIQLAQIYDCDMVQVEFIEIGENGGTRGIHCGVQGKIEERHSLLLEYAKGNITNNIWSKLFKRELIANMKFDVNYAVGEDAKFVYECCNESKGVYVTDYVGYYYYCRTDSVMRQKFHPKRIEYLHLLDEQIQENWNKQDIREILIKRINLDEINMVSHLAKTDMWEEYIPLLRHYIRKYASSVMLSNKVTCRNKCIILGIIFLPKMYRKLKIKRLDFF